PKACKENSRTASSSSPPPRGPSRLVESPLLLHSGRAVPHDHGPRPHPSRRNLDAVGRERRVGGGELGHALRWHAANLGDLAHPEEVRPRMLLGDPSVGGERDTARAARYPHSRPDALGAPDRAGGAQAPPAGDERHPRPLTLGVATDAELAVPAVRP